MRDLHWARNRPVETSVAANIITELILSWLEPVLTPALDPEKWYFWQFETLCTCQKFFANNLQVKFGLFCRCGHSTEMALLSVLSDLLWMTDAGNGARLVLLDLSVTFDTVVHSLLLKKVAWWDLFAGYLKWLTLYLSCSFHQVLLKHSIDHQYHLFTDDSELYSCWLVQWESALQAVCNLEYCFSEILRWMNADKLLNEQKTEMACFWTVV